MHTDGLKVDQLQVRCPFCGGVHTHQWHGEADALRTASCTPYDAVYRITVTTRERITAMREQYPAPDGVVGLIPLRVGFCFEVDGPDEDVVGIILETTVGGFVLWLPLGSAVGLAGHLADIAENREQLRLEYLERLQTSLSAPCRATNAAGVV